MGIRNRLFGPSAEERAQQKQQFGLYLRNLLLSGERSHESGIVWSSIVSEDERYVGGIVSFSLQTFIYVEMPGYSDLMQFQEHEKERSRAVWQVIVGMVFDAIDLDEVSPLPKFLSTHGLAILGKDSPFKFVESFFNPNMSACGWWNDPSGKASSFIFRHRNQIVLLNLPSNPEIMQVIAEEVFHAAHDGIEADEQYRFARTQFRPDEIVLGVDRYRFYEPTLTLTWGGVSGGDFRDQVDRGWLYIEAAKKGGDGSAVLLMKSPDHAERLYRAIRAPRLIAQKLSSGTRWKDLVDLIQPHVSARLAAELRLFIDEA